MTLNHQKLERKFSECQNVPDYIVQGVNTKLQYFAFAKKSVIFLCENPRKYTSFSKHFGSRFLCLKFCVCKMQP